MGGATDPSAGILWGVFIQVCYCEHDVLRQNCDDTLTTHDVVAEAETLCRHPHPPTLTLHFAAKMMGGLPSSFLKKNMDQIFFFKKVCGEGCETNSH